MPQAFPLSECERLKMSEMTRCFKGSLWVPGHTAGDTAGWRCDGFCPGAPAGGVSSRPTRAVTGQLGVESRMTWGCRQLGQRECDRAAWGWSREMLQPQAGVSHG